MLKNRGILIKQQQNFFHIQRNTSCAAYISENFFLPNYTIQKFDPIFVDQGSKTYDLTKTWVKKGSMLMLNCTLDLVTFEENGQFIYSDLIYEDSKIFWLKPYRIRVLFSAKIDTKYYFSTLSFSAYLNSSQTTVNAVVIYNRTYTLLKSQTITEDRQFLDMICTPAILKAKCEIIAISFTRNDMIYVSSENDNHINFSFENKTSSNLGFELSYSNTNFYENYVTILMTSTESKFDTNLIGFEFYSSTKGSTEFKLIDFDTKCDNFSCAYFLSTQNGKHINYTIIQSFLIEFNKGYNQIYLNRSYRYEKKMMIAVDFNYWDKYFSFQTTYTNFYDYFIKSNVLYSLYGKKISFRCLVDREFYYSFRKVEFTYNHSNTYNIISSFKYKSFGMESLAKKVTIVIPITMSKGTTTILAVTKDSKLDSRLKNQTNITSSIYSQDNTNIITDLATESLEMIYTRKKKVFVTSN
ncbi:unnamed protein product [Brachionus calyciflorus]|uniref:Uncharacterized protein n=1 Tax=Brachionus calyciflorus TaxID=104777 RepID=A0A814I219_9BILA|nr:unnamed protein product [Brachionus calyciflorus]